VLPAHAGMVPVQVAARARVSALPAHAGMIPCRRHRSGSPIRVPRARGDGPVFRQRWICEAQDVGSQVGHGTPSASLPRRRWAWQGLIYRLWRGLSAGEIVLVPPVRASEPLQVSHEPSPGRTCSRGGERALGDLVLVGVVLGERVGERGRELSGGSERGRSNRRQDLGRDRDLDFTGYPRGPGRAVW